MNQPKQIRTLPGETGRTAGYINGRESVLFELNRVQP
jgi:hypothetical protein